MASPKPGASADLTLSDDPDALQGRGIRLADLDVGRVATALALVRGAAARATRSRRAGLALGGLGVALAATSLLPLLGAVGYLLLACAAITLVAARG